MLRTLDQLVKVRSQLALGLRQYFRSVRDAPDLSEKLPAYMGGRTPSSLYIEPDVLKRERKSERRHSEPMRREGEGEHKRVGRERLRMKLAHEAQDIEGELPYGERERETERRVTWGQERKAMEHSQQRCAILLGPPGQGKSLLAQMGAHVLARASLDNLDKEEVVAGEVALPIVVALDALAKGDALDGERPDEALRRCLRATLQQQGCPDIAANYLADHVHESRSWLFLDALDEASDDEALDGVLTALKNTQCRVIITSRPYGYEGRRLPFNLTEYTEYRLAPFTAEQARAFVNNWFGGVEAQGRMNELLARSLSVQQLSQSPFLLTLLCWVAERHDLSPDITRTQLYERIVCDLLGLPVNRTGPLDEQRAIEWLPLLTEIVLTFFQQNAGRAPMPSERLLNLMEASPKRPGPLGLTPLQTASLTPRQQASYLLDELREKRLLVPLSPDRSAYVAPHRSILEYLTACALKDKIANSEPQEPGSTSPRAGQSVWKFVDKNAWRPEWQEVIVFLAGKLDGPKPLFDRLSDPQPTATNRYGDDYFRHRLALAALCLPEIRADLRTSCSELIDRITTAVFSLWRVHEIKHTLPCVPHVTQALPALGQVNGRMGEMPLLHWLCDRLGSADCDDRRLATEAVGKIGPPAGAAEILGRLTELLGAEKPEVRRAVVEAVGEIGAPAATPKLLVCCTGGGTGSLFARDSFEGAAAAWALGKIGPPAATPEILGRLAELLRSENANVQLAAAEALSSIGSAGAMPEILGRLTKLLDAEEREVQWGAAYALRKIGPPAATPKILDRLAELLGAEEPEVRRAVVEAVGEIGGPAATPKILGGLTKLLDARDLFERAAAAQALGSIGALAAIPEILDCLAKLLSAADLTVGEKAAEALSSIGAAGAMPEILGRLTKLLDAEEWEVQWGAAYALRKIGPPAATPKILDRLAELLSAADPTVREKAVEAVGGIGAAAATPEILDRLAELLDVKDKWVQATVVEAVGKIGPSAGTAEILARLAKLLSAADPTVREKAVEAVGGIGAAAATPEILGRVNELLDADAWQVQSGAARAVAQLMAQGIRIFEERKGGIKRWEVRPVAELSQ